MTFKKQITAVVLLMCILFTPALTSSDSALAYDRIHTDVAVRDDSTDVLHSANNAIYFETESSYRNSMNLYVKSANYAIGEKIDLIIYTCFSNYIVDITFSENGFILAGDFEIIGDEIHFSVLHIPNSEKPMLSANVILDNGDLLTGNLFGIVRDGQLFVNPHSYSLAQNAYLRYSGEYDAKIKMLENLKENKKLEKTEEPRTKNTCDIQRSSTDETASVITGQIKWTDANANEQPLRFCKIEFYERYTDTLVAYMGETFTDKNGNYSFEFIENTIDVTVIIYAQGTDVTVCDDGGTPYWYWIEHETEPALKSITPGSVININKSFDIPDDYAIDVDRDYFPRALQVAQAAICASMYYEAMKGTDVEDVNISYPHSMNREGSFYSKSTKVIYIVGDITGNGFVPFASDDPGVFADGRVDSFESWDAITHEYGHFVSDHEGIYDNPGGWHAISWDMAEHYIDHYEGTATSCENACALKYGIFVENNFSLEECKYKGSALSWSEGVATFFGELAQLYFKENYIDEQWSNEIPTFADYSYYSYRFNNPYDVGRSFIETNDPNTATSELGVCRILYDLYDGRNKDDLPNDSNPNEVFDQETFDKVTLGHQGIWDYIINVDTNNNGNTDDETKAKTLYQFIEYLRSSDSGYPKSQLSNLGEILAEHGLATSAPTIPSMTANNPQVQFTWIEHNSSGYLNARKFQVNFYNENYNLIGSTAPQVINFDTSHTGIITIDDELWQNVMNCSSNFYVSITMYECNGVINNPIDNEHTTSFESAYIMYFSPGHIHDYTSSYLKYSSSQHKAYCLCGDFIYESHFFVSGGVYPSCRECGYISKGNVPIIKPTML